MFSDPRLATLQASLATHLFIFAEEEGKKGSGYSDAILHLGTTAVEQCDYAVVQMAENAAGKYYRSSKLTRTAPRLT